MLEVMLPALVAALILVGIHGYLGIHIIARGVIFVDLALAQVAAVGWTAGKLGLAAWLAGKTGLSPETSAYLLGFGSTLAAAGLISITRMQGTRVPQEAIIGIVYVVSSAATILLASQAPSGAEHVQDLLTGSLLWTTWPTIAKTALLYGALGVAHWIFRHRFFTISLHPEEAHQRGWRVALWDFLFYALFGLVVTSSVDIAGVLVVFSFLVIPAVIAFLFTDKPRLLLVIAWTAGTLATVLGLLVSYAADLPTGPLVVCAFAAALLVAFAIRALLGKRNGIAPAA
ncbi:MAG: iron chelate uptake ABC transporter family permease subunit [Gemmatimonadales bacterium]